MEAKTWSVHPWSLRATLLPVCLGAFSLAAVVVAVTGIVWGTLGRTNAAGPWVLLVFGLGLGAIEGAFSLLTTRKVSTKDGTTFQFDSPLRHATVKTSELVRVQRAMPTLDWAHIYPLVLKTPEASLLLAPGISDLAGLRAALLQANPTFKWDL